MVLVDIRETPSAKAADVFPADSARQGLRGAHRPARARQEPGVNRESVAETGLTLEQLQDLVDRMKAAKFGVIFFGMGLSMTRGKHMNSAGVLTLAAEMNAFTKFVVHADARPRQRHRRRHGAALDDGLPVRRQPVPGLSALQSRRVLDGGPAGPRRQRRRARAGRRSRARRCRSRRSTTWRGSRRSCSTRR